MGAHAAVAARAEQIEQAPDGERKLGGEGIEIDDGAGFGQLDPPILCGIIGFDGEGEGGGMAGHAPAAAQEDGEEGEQEQLQHDAQTHAPDRALRAGAGGALRPAEGECVH